MSGLIGDMNLRGVGMILDAPQRVAGFQKTMAEIPQTWADTAYRQAQVPLTQAQTSKTLIDAQLAYLMGSRALSGGQGTGTSYDPTPSPYTPEPGAEGAEGGAGGGAGGGGGGGGAGGSGGSGGGGGPPTGDLLTRRTDPSLNYAWLGPRTAGSSMLSGVATPQAPIQLAATQPATQPASATLAGYAGAGPGIFLGATAAQPVPSYGGTITASPPPGPAPEQPAPQPPSQPPQRLAAPPGPHPSAAAILGYPGQVGTGGQAQPAQVPPQLQLPPNLQQQFQGTGLPPIGPYVGAPGSAQLAPMGQPASRDMSVTGSRAGRWVPEVGHYVPNSLANDFYRSQIGLPPYTYPVTPQEAQGRLQAQINTMVQQLLQTVHDLPTWHAALDRAYAMGLITDGQRAHLYNNPQLQGAVDRQHTDPEIVKRRDAEEANRGNVWDGTKYVPNPTAAWQWLHEHFPAGRPGPGGTIIPEQPIPMLPPGATPGAPGTNPPGPRSELAPPPATGAATVPTGGPGATGAGQPSGWFTDYAGRLLRHEGGPAGVTNLASGASGLYQWMPSDKVTGAPGTKANVARAALPDVVAGMTSQQIDAHKFTPEQEFKMLQRFSTDNAIAMRQMGQRVTPASLFLAHALGARGLDRLRNTPQNTPMEQASPAATRDNKYLQGKTAGDVARYAIANFGNNTLTEDDIRNARPPGVTQTAGPGAAQPPAPQALPPAGGPPVQQTNLPYTPMPQYAPGVPQMIERNIANDNQAVETAGHRAGNAQNTLQTFLNMRNLAATMGERAFGTGGEWRANANKLISTILGENPGLKAWADQWMGTDFANEAKRVDFIKQSVRALADLEAAIPGAHVGVGLHEMLGKGSPSIDMEKATVDDLINYTIVASQRTIDYYNDLNKRVTDAGSEYQRTTLWGQGYQPVERQVTQDWTANENSVHALKVYEAAYRMMNGDPKWKEQLDDKTEIGRAQQTEAVQIARRLVPNWVPKKGQ